jgi:hypothetical protein
MARGARSASARARETHRRFVLGVSCMTSASADGAAEQASSLFDSVGVRAAEGVARAREPG